MSSSKLWYDNQANNWNEALPIGNGRLGGMIFGGVQEDKIQLSEESMYNGAPINRINPLAKENINRVKALIKEDRLYEAKELALIALNGCPRYFGPYQTLCDLNLRFLVPHPNDLRSCINYKRELDLTTSVAKVEYEVNDCIYKREYFCSAVDNALFIKLSSNKNSMISCNINLARRPFDPGTKIAGKNQIVMTGELCRDGIKYCCMVEGTIFGNGKIIAQGDSIQIHNADEALIKVVAQTSYRKFNPYLDCEDKLDKINNLTYQTIKQKHIDDYQTLYNKIKLNINNNKNNDTIPTNKRLEKFKNDPVDMGLIELYFNYGRYLLISSSRHNTLPANLQGIWNNEFTPAWESMYTININLQMNYWPAEICGLADCHMSVFNLIKLMYKNGKKTARDMYECNGFVAHHNTNIWGDTSPSGANCYIWPFGAAWLCLHIWEHYQFTLDQKFLQDYYEIIKESLEFFYDYLEEDEEGYFITGLSQSPENRYKLQNGESGMLASNPAMDDQIIKELLSAYISASKVLNINNECVKKAKVLIDRIRTPQIGKDGRILEWNEEVKELELGHRHMSHLFSLYPGSMINQSTPDLLKAAEQSIEYRVINGGGSTGWSSAWIINLYARLNSGDKCYYFIKNMLKNFTYYNLFNAHPPFQIDGNFGAVAGIAEMLLQSQNNVLKFLPALPEDWHEGKVEGLRARGAFGVDIEWKDNKLQEVVLESHKGKDCYININQKIKVTYEGKVVDLVEIKPELYKFSTVEGKKYKINLDK